MSEILHKNAVITGCVHAFCLACDCFFKNLEDAEPHVKTFSHSKNLCLIPYCDKFKDENIRKVKPGYFCESCNVILLTAMKMEFHVMEEDHRQNRGRMSLKKLERGVMAFNKVYVEDRAWHSLMDDGVCSLCDTEFDDGNQHKGEFKHILNLVQKPVKFGSNNAIYRQTDHSTIHCVTCNVLIDFNTRNEHFNDVAHADRYAECIRANDGCINKKENTKKIESLTSNENLPGPSEKRNIENDDKKISRDNNISKILSCMPKYQSNDIDVNFESDKVFCRKCCVDIEFNYDDIEKHIAEHLKTKRVQSGVRYPTDVDKNIYCTKPEANKNPDHNSDSSDEVIHIPILIQPLEPSCSRRNGDNSDNDDKSIDSSSTADIEDIVKELEINNEKCESNDAKLFAKANHLTYNEENGKAFCRICQVKLPSSFKSMKEHVQGASHNKNIPPPEVLRPQTKTGNNLRKQSMKRFVYSVKTLSRLYPEDCIINGRYCLNQLSFFFIRENHRDLRCLLCEKNIYYRPPFYKFEVQAHVDADSHHSKMEAIPVITSEPSEFIREIRPDSFHCGFCNLILSGWNQMEDHLKCTDHLTKKSSQNGRLQREVGVRLLSSPFAGLFY